MVRSRPFGNIRKLSSGSYQARYDHLGTRQPANVTFATKADPRACLTTVETDLLHDTYASQLAHILAEFEAVELRKITPAQVWSWHGRLSQSGLHANTVAKVYRRFRTMLDTAVDDGILRTNPVHITGAAVERSIERPMLDWDDPSGALRPSIRGSERSCGSDALEIAVALYRPVFDDTTSGTWEPSTMQRI